MFEYLYEWMRNIAYYMILVTALLQMMPNQDYKKYIRFFTGMILILLLLTPVLKICGMEQQFSKLYEGKEYENKVREIKESTKYLEEINSADYLKETPDEEKESAVIRVEEVEIGE